MNWNDSPSRTTESQSSARHDRPTITIDPSAPDMSRKASSSTPDSADAPPVTDFHLPNDVKECHKKILDQEIRNAKLQDRCLRWKQARSKDQESVLRANGAVTRSQIEMTKYQQRTIEVEQKNATLVKLVAEAESKLKEEQDKVHKLRIEYDLLQQENARQQKLASEDDNIDQGTRHKLHDLIGDFENSTMRFIADLEHHFRGSTERLIHDRNWILRENDERRNELRNPRPTARLENAQPVVTGATANVSVREDASGERKRSSDDLLDRTAKKAKLGRLT